MSSAQRHSGFTLVEISIVILVIGLIISGILVGRDLILAAQIRKQVAQIDSYNNAVNAFRVKYNCLPGDCKKAVDFGLGIANGAGDNGNGNGMLDVAYRQDASGYIETNTVWQHLSRAQMISGNYTQNTPVAGYDGGVIPGVESPPLALKMAGLQGNPTGGIVLAYSEQLRNFTPFSTAWFLTTTNLDYENPVGYTGAIAYMLDSKMDDGLPFRGNMVAAQNAVLGLCMSGSCSMPLTWGMTVGDTGNQDACVVDGQSPEQYNANSMEISDAICALVIKTAF